MNSSSVSRLVVHKKGKIIYIERYTTAIPYATLRRAGTKEKRAANRVQRKTPRSDAVLAVPRAPRGVARFHGDVSFRNVRGWDFTTPSA